MKPVAWMVGTSAATGFVAWATVAGSVRTELLLGMLGPLLVAVVSWMVAERTYRRDRSPSWFCLLPTLAAIPIRPMSLTG